MAGKAIRNAKTGKKAIARTERQAKALELRKAGETYETIGKAIGTNASGAWEVVYRALLRVVKEPGEAVLKLELSRLDALARACWGPAIEGDYQAIATWLRIAERRAKLLGLDAAQKHTITNGAEEGDVMASAVQSLLSDPEGRALVLAELEKQRNVVEVEQEDSE